MSSSKDAINNFKITGDYVMSKKSMEVFSKILNKGSVELKEGREVFKLGSKDYEVEIPLEVFLKMFRGVFVYDEKTGNRAFKYEKMKEIGLEYYEALIKTIKSAANDEMF